MNADQQYISEFGEVLLYITGGLLFLAISFFVSSLIRPSRPAPEKLATYESGEEPSGSAWAQFNIRFYVIALIFLLFEAEIVFLFPWATVFADASLVEATDGLWGIFAVTEAVIFIVILAFGLAYTWVRGHLDWVKPHPSPTQYDSPVPGNLYSSINQKYAGKRGPEKEELKS